MAKSTAQALNEDGQVVTASAEVIAKAIEKGTLKAMPKKAKPAEPVKADDGKRV